MLRLVQNPHDEAAIAEAHAEGQRDPKAYAVFLERVGAATSDPALASYWLTEAANVWHSALADAHRAARTLMLAIDRDPLQPVPAERLAELYRQKGDNKALAALLERRAKALLPMAAVDVPVREQLAAIFEELGRLWSEPPLATPEKAIEHFRQAIEYDPGNEYAIYTVRELLKGQGALQDALPYYEQERALTQDGERKLALFADEGELRQRLGDWDGAAEAFRRALSLDATDPTTRQQLATLVLEKARAGAAPSAAERDEAVRLFVGLTLEFGGEHGFLYSLCALELTPDHDTAFEQAFTLGQQLGRLAELAPHAAAYLQANPRGKHLATAQSLAMPVAPQQAAFEAPPDLAPAAEAFVTPPDDDSMTVVDEAALEALRERSRVERESAPEPPALATTPQDPAAATPQAPPVEMQAPPAAEPVASPSVQQPMVEQSPLEALLSKAAGLAAKNRKNEAYKFYREALDLSPAEPEALAFVETHLKRIRKFGELRDLLWVASKAAGPGEPATSWLREVASLCETQLRDTEGAIEAWQRIFEFDPDTARADLKRLLIAAGRWDALAQVLSQEADQAPDAEARIALEKELAELHEDKRGDAAAAGACWSRIAGMAVGEAEPIWRAVSLFERAGQLQPAAEVIASSIQAVRNPATLSDLYKKLGSLREAMGDLAGAGEALREGALEAKRDDLWELAEGYFVRAQSWEQAAAVVHERAQAADGKAQAALLTREAEYTLSGGDRDAAVMLLERASEIDPENQEISGKLEGLFADAGQSAQLIQFLLRRAEGLQDKDARIDMRRRASSLQRQSGDLEGARESLELVLLDREDVAVLQELAEEAESGGDAGRAVDFLKRWADASSEQTVKAQVILRQARLLVEPLGELEGAVDCYRAILEIEPKNQEALQKVADLELQRGEPQSAAKALEALLQLQEGEQARLEIAQRLIDLYDNQLHQEADLMRTLNLVHETDPDDFEAVGRLCDLAERLEQWPEYAQYLGELISVEGDEEELGRMTLRLSDILQDKLDRKEDALQRLGEAGDLGSAECRQAYVELGDALGKQREVATRLVGWYREAPGSAERTTALHDAFERFATAGADEDAIAVAKDLARTRAAEVSIASRLEEIAIRARDLNALAIAHGLAVRELSGQERAEEMVRQAEALAKAGVELAEAALHGEQALTSVEPAEVEPLLARLGRLVGSAAAIVDVYEHQIGRCKSPEDRLRALARAAQVASEQGQLERAGGFFDLALSGSGDPETIDALERAAREADSVSGGKTVTTRLAESLAQGGQGVRDGGRTRAALLRRAAGMALYELEDRQRAFQWVGDSLVAHVSDETLEALVDMGRAESDFKLVETVLSRALEEVFDGPLVRKLLATRGRLRRDELDDVRGAAEDLKRLHDLSPGDSDVVGELSALYTSLEDYRGMVQLFEDQILRSKDQGLRAELAREVALLWRDKLNDPRETADAWRRVLRLEPGDPEATEGLTEAKQAMLKHLPDPTPEPTPESSGDEEALGAPGAGELPAPAAESGSLQDGEQAGLADAADEQAQDAGETVQASAAPEPLPYELPADSSDADEAGEVLSSSPDTTQSPEPASDSIDIGLDSLVPDGPPSPASEAPAEANEEIVTSAPSEPPAGGAVSSIPPSGPASSRGGRRKKKKKKKGGGNELLADDSEQQDD